MLLNILLLKYTIEIRNTDNKNGFLNILHNLIFWTAKFENFKKFVIIHHQAIMRINFKIMHFFLYLIKILLLNK